MENLSSDSSAGVEFRLDDLAHQLEVAYRDRSGQGAPRVEALFAIGTEKDRVGDPFRLRELLDVVTAAVPAQSVDVIRLSFTGAADQPLIIEITGIGALPSAAAGLLSRLGGHVLEMKRALQPKLRLSLPFGTAAPGEVTAAEVPAQASGGAFAGLRMLIADDSPTNLMVMQEMLADTGATLVAVHDGQQALDAWRAGKFDLLLLDIAMPQVDGLTALKTIRAEEEVEGREETSAVAVTANAMPHQVAEYILGGFDTHLSKPFRRRELISTIASLCHTA